MFDITKEDIKLLDDSDLRELIGKLCEATLKKQHHSPSCVTYGGSQDAKDGGVDVRVCLENGKVAGFIPRSNTVFQVKLYDLVGEKIIQEMKPRGILRDCIKDLSDIGGAYIIACGKADTTDSMMMARKTKMIEAVKDQATARRLKCDFYDSQRIATWVNEFPSVIIWIRNKIGKQLYGWQPYANWSNSKEGLEDKYLIDGVRILNLAETNSLESSPAEAINKIRQTLSMPASCVRLVGLSGVGKTRLAQALFDERVGLYALNSDEAIYTDMSKLPDPIPTTMAEDLCARNEKTILIIDNCEPELHRKLAKICLRPNSCISLLTIEYDIQTDQTEEVEVFKIEPSTQELIGEMLTNRFPDIGQLNAFRIAKFSGGNARIAIALANTIKLSDDISTFNDSQLFDRLFWQNQSLDRNLLIAAKACALVYSFNSEDMKEMELIEKISGLSQTEIHRHIAELLRRNLMQKRGKWRAVLPHALANWLAHRILEEIPVYRLKSIFTNDCPRMLFSFSHRLKYMHNSDVAKKIVIDWLSPNGMLADITNLEYSNIGIFQNIAPVLPPITLQAIEDIVHSEDADKFFSRQNPHHIIFTNILCSIAYDEQLFKRCVLLLILFAQKEKTNENREPVIRKLTTLFQMKLSGTQASAQTRLEVITEMVNGNNKDLGFTLLDTALRTGRFEYPSINDFGARERDIGLYPRTFQEQKDWYSVFIQYLKGIIESGDTESSNRSKAIFAKNLLGLFRAGMIDEIEQLINNGHLGDEWGQGWMALYELIGRDKEKMPQDLLKRLESLKNKIKPRTLSEKARAYVTNSPGFRYYLLKAEHGNEEIKEIGKDLASDNNTLISILPEAIKVNSTHLFSLGQGLAEACESPYNLWTLIQAQILLAKRPQGYLLLEGFLQALNKRNPDLVETILDETVENDLADYFPRLQTSVPINERGINRLIRSIEFGKAPLDEYNHIGFGAAHETIPDNELLKILNLLLNSHDGLNVTMDIFCMRIFNKEPYEISEEMLTFGRSLIIRYDFIKHTYHTQIGFDLSQIVECCFDNNDPEVEAQTKQLCEQIKKGLTDYSIYASDCCDVLYSFAKVQPIILLDVFFNEKQPWQVINAFYDDSSRIIINKIDTDVLLDWCSKKPEERYYFLASILNPFVTNADLQSWNPLALALMDNAPDPCLVLESLSYHFSPSSWSGEYSNALKKSLILIKELLRHPNPKIQTFAKRKADQYEQQILREMDKEKEENSRGFE